MCIVHLRFSSLSTLSPVQGKTCFTTPDSFSTNANFPLRDSWSDVQRSMFLGVQQQALQRTREGATVVARRIVAQNSLSQYVANSQAKLVLFATGDPGASTHWLKQIRIAVHVDDASEKKQMSVSAQSRHSIQAQTTVVTYHSCDRRSCLGCGTLRLQALCYAAQQCAVVSCIGTVVNQNRPLCNIGLVLKSYAESSLSMILGAWLVFTETYTDVLDAALLGPSRNSRIEWVDDAFFGYICSAKVRGASFFRAFRAPTDCCWRCASLHASAQNAKWHEPAAPSARPRILHACRTSRPRQRSPRGGWS